jgi:hypothetical protein
VNLQIKEYTNRDSQRPEGCVALDGGHTWPFFSTPTVWDILVAEDATEGGKQETGVCYKKGHDHHISMWDKYVTNSGTLNQTTRIIPDGNLPLVV